MTADYPIRFAEQLRQHLRALRKKRSLTQAQLGQLLGVSQARIAEIEAKPGLVNFEQLLHILSALDVTLALHDGHSAPEPDAPERGVTRTEASTPSISNKQLDQPDQPAKLDKRGEW